MTPNYQGTADEYAKYGGNLNIWQQLALLSQWAPLVSFAQRFVAEPDPYRKSIVVSDASEWMASKTSAKVDDELVRLLADILKTPQGEALVRWGLSKTEAAK